ncbi:hypothetical protein LQZ19_00815 [Treponema primitia]|uniref:hypothetical protein n=1 Tax=Treponema primitia TaxID=88058 RepID=UPI003980C611
MLIGLNKCEGILTAKAQKAKKEERGIFLFPILFRLLRLCGCFFYPEERRVMQVGVHR